MATEKEMEAEILMFLFEQEAKRADSDVLEWSVEEIKKLINKFG